MIECNYFIQLLYRNEQLKTHKYHSVPHIVNAFNYSLIQNMLFNIIVKRILVLDFETFTISAEVVLQSKGVVTTSSIIKVAFSIVVFIITKWITWIKSSRTWWTWITHLPNVSFYLRTWDTPSHSLICKRVLSQTAKSTVLCFANYIKNNL